MFQIGVVGKSLNLKKIFVSKAEPIKQGVTHTELQIVGRGARTQVQIVGSSTVHRYG